MCIICTYSTSYLSSLAQGTDLTDIARLGPKVSEEWAVSHLLHCNCSTILTIIGRYIGVISLDTMHNSKLKSSTCSALRITLDPLQWVVDAETIVLHQPPSRFVAARRLSIELPRFVWKVARNTWIMKWQCFLRKTTLVFDMRRIQCLGFMDYWFFTSSSDLKNSSKKFRTWLHSLRNGFVKSSPWSSLLSAMPSYSFLVCHSCTVMSDI